MEVTVFRGTLTLQVGHEKNICFDSPQKVTNRKTKAQKRGALKMLGRYNNITWNDALEKGQFSGVS